MRRLWALALVGCALANNASFVINIHITHHAGTTLCHVAQANVNASAKGCFANTRYPPQQTASYLAALAAEQLVFVNWEFRAPPRPPLSTFDWETEQVTSILVVRDPLERLLADDGYHSRFGPVSDGQNWYRKWTHESWDAYLASEFTDNYQLRILANGARDATGLAAAQALATRFTYIIDLACLDYSLEAIAPQLGWTFERRPHHRLAPITERFGNTTRLALFKQRNEFDISFYRWAQKKSVVVCDETATAHLDY